MGEVEEEEATEQQVRQTGCISTMPTPAQRSMPNAV